MSAKLQHPETNDPLRSVLEAMVALIVRRAARGLPPLRQGMGVHAGDRR